MGLNDDSVKIITIQDKVNQTPKWKRKIKGFMYGVKLKINIFRTRPFKFIRNTWHLRHELANFYDFDFSSNLELYVKSLELTEKRLRHGFTESSESNADVIKEFRELYYKLHGTWQNGVPIPWYKRMVGVDYEITPSYFELAGGDHDRTDFGFKAFRCEGCTKCADDKTCSEMISINTGTNKNGDNYYTEIEQKEIYELAWKLEVTDKKRFNELLLKYEQWWD